MSRRKLQLVPDEGAKPLDMAGDIYAEVRALAHDPKRWARMHIIAERRASLDLHQPAHRRLWTDWRQR